MERVEHRELVTQRQERKFLTPGAGGIKGRGITGNQLRATWQKLKPWAALVGS